MKTRQEYLAICQTCLKSKFDKKKGIVCTLTDEHAAFHTNDCPDYDPEKKAIRRQEATKQRVKEAKEEEKGLFSGKAGIVGGTIITILGLAWIILGLVLMNRFFFYPIILIIGGIISISKGIGKKAKNNRIDQSTVIDDELDEIV